ncbi:MAG: bifunctional (p)ppGpp synthetase/guanosine-3',5'-bis(diphosphate) 3'-pyrophosphohydrolase, partial [Spirochaetaceae bacterium]|nr:bifunctional (p)ppGpp synthetase/guanosine-3',5'-bis(diphosphate) 3'-pyrophosphohydrolase [Spirochaetaceae bacterium]
QQAAAQQEHFETEGQTPGHLSGQGQKKTASQGRAEGESASQSAESAEPIKIRVGDTTNFLVKIAGCCCPVPGQPITGYVSRGRGIIVHRQGCSNFNLIPEIAERKIDVIWEKTPEKTKVRTRS